MKLELNDYSFDESVETSKFKVIEDFDENQNPRMRIQGVCQQADKVNKNNRLYTKPVLQSAMSKFEHRIRNGRAFGEVDHPDFRPLLKNTSHLVNKVWWDDKNPSLVMCEVTVANTPQGEILKEVVRAGGRPGFSSRGYGDADKVKIGTREVTKIKDGFELHSFDFVINPSVSSARINKIMESAVLKLKEVSMDIETVEALRKAYPELVKKVETEILEGAAEVIENDSKQKIKDLEAKISTHESELETLKTQLGEKDATIEKYTKLVDSVTKSLKDGEFISSETDGNGDKESEALKQTISSLEDENKNLKTKLDENATKVTNLEQKVTKSEVEARVDDLIKGHKYETALREKFKDCKTVEEVDQKFEQEKTFIQSLEENFGHTVPKPKGHREDEDAGNDVDAEKAKIREQAKRLAGIKGGAK